MSRLVAVVGPTGIGKSQLAIHLALLFNGEIVSADSRQVYRLMDIGTDKLLPHERSGIPHHLIDIINPDEDFSLARYQELALAAIADIQSRGKLPFLVGGSGLYVWAVLEGWHVPRVSPDSEFRYNLERKAEETGIDELYNELVRTDPVAAQKIDRRNVRRIIRALEVRRQTGERFSTLGYKQAPTFETFIIGLTAARSEVYRRVDERIDRMVAGGLVSEVENLLKIGYDFNLSALSGIGYRQIREYLEGALTLEAAKARIKTETHRFIRHQYAWFRLTDKRIHWFDVQQQGDSDIEKALSEFMSKNIEGRS